MRSSLSGLRALVTGAGGFVGAHVAAALAEMGVTVVGAARPPRSSECAFCALDLQRRIHCVEVDVRDRGQVDELIRRVEPDVIVHLAGKALAPDALRDPQQTFSVNVMGTINILEAVRRFPHARRVLVASSGHALGEVEPDFLPRAGFPEDTAPGLGSPYAASKAMAEMAVRSYVRTYGGALPAIGIVRSANAFGSGDPTGRVAPTLVGFALGPERRVPLAVIRPGRQFLYISDLVAGYVRALTAMRDGDSSMGETPTYHLAIERYSNNGSPYIRMGEFAHLVAGLFGASVDDSSARPGENLVQAIDCARTRRALGWEPHIGLEEGLLRLGRWRRSIGDPAVMRRAAEDDISAALTAIFEISESPAVKPEGGRYASDVSSGQGEGAVRRAA